MYVCTFIAFAMCLDTKYILYVHIQLVVYKCNVVILFGDDHIQYILEKHDLRVEKSQLRFLVSITINTKKKKKDF